jgi:hypothetical protein
MRRRTSLLLAALLALPTASCMSAPPTTLTSMRVESAFPDDALTRADPSTLTGRRMALPTAGCAGDDCSDVAALNRLDGFDVLPRIALRLPQDANLPALAGGGLSLRDLSTDRRVGLERFTWIRPSGQLSAWPEVPLTPAHRYALELGTAGNRRVLSTFTTFSATGPMRSIAAAIRDGKAGRAIGALRGDRTVNRATGVRFFADMGQPAVSDVEVLSTLADSPERLSTVTLTTPSWLDGDRRIALDAAGRPRVTGENEAACLVAMPTGAPPAGGWPAVIFAHGLGGSRFHSLRVSQTFLDKGHAVISCDAVGHGYGPRSRTVLVDSFSSVDVATPGRGVDTDHDGTIGRSEGFAPSGTAAERLRTGYSAAIMQSASDQLLLIAALARGLDVDHDGSLDLSPGVAGVFAESAGGFYTTVARGAAGRYPPVVLAVTGSSPIDFQRTSYAERPAMLQALASRRPAIAVPNQDLDRGTPVVRAPRITVISRGDSDVAEVLSRLGWLQRAASPDLWATAAPTPVLMQIARGDPSLDNRLSAQLAIAGGWAKAVSIWRFDLVSGRKPRSRVPANVLAQIHTRTGGALIDAHHLIDLADAQDQAATFLASSGQEVRDPDAGGIRWQIGLSSWRELTS